MPVKRSIPWSEWLLVVAAFGYTVAVYLVAAIPGLSRVAHVFLALMAGSLLLHAPRGKVRLAQEPVLLLTTGLALYALASTLWAQDFNQALSRASSLWVSLAAFVTLWVAFAKGLTLKPVIYGSVVGALVNAAVSVVQTKTGGVLRAEGLTGNANALALQLSMAGLIVLAMAKEGKRWPLVFTIFMFGVATAVSGSRKVVAVWPMLAIFVGRGIVVRVRASYAAIGAALVGIPVLVALGSIGVRGMLGVVQNLYVYSRFVRFFEGRDTSAATRLDMIGEGWRLWLEAPILGHGIDQFRVLSQFATYSHNNYIEMLATLGIVGFILYYSVYLLLFLRGWRTRRTVRL